MKVIDVDDIDTKDTVVAVAAIEEVIMVTEDEGTADSFQTFILKKCF
jgi:hypothetical protein